MSHWQGTTGMLRSPRTLSRFTLCSLTTTCSPPQWDIIAGLEQQLASIIGQALPAFLDRVIEDLSNALSPCTSIRQLKDDVHRVRAVETQARTLRQEILQVDGPCGKLYKVEKVHTHLKDVIFALEEVTLHGDVDLEGMLELYRAEELFYQSRPDL